MSSFRAIRIAVLLLAFSAIESSEATYFTGRSFTLDLPPSPGSYVDRADREELHRLQATRTSSQCSFAETQSGLTAASFFGPEIGTLSAEEFRILEPLLTEVIETAMEVIMPFKLHFARPRPYEEDTSIIPCIRMPPGGRSYPSGHAAAGEAVANLLVRIFPERRAALADEATAIGDNRILGGVHHPSDVSAGRDIGRQLSEALLENENFLADFIRVRALLGR